MTNADQNEAQHPSLPDGFFGGLTRQQEILLKILLESDGKWMKSNEICRKMRNQYDWNVPDAGGAIGGPLSGFTRYYSKRLTEQLIERRHSRASRKPQEYRINKIHEEELRTRL